MGSLGPGSGWSAAGSPWHANQDYLQSLTDKLAEEEEKLQSLKLTQKHVKMAFDDMRRQTLETRHRADEMANTQAKILAETDSMQDGASELAHHNAEISRQCQDLRQEIKQLTEGREQLLHQTEEMKEDIDIEREAHIRIKQIVGKAQRGVIQLTNEKNELRKQVLASKKILEQLVFKLKNHQMKNSLFLVDVNESFVRDEGRDSSWMGQPS